MALHTFRILQRISEEAHKYNAQEVKRLIKVFDGAIKEDFGTNPDPKAEQLIAKMRLAKIKFSAAVNDQTRRDWMEEAEQALDDVVEIVWEQNHKPSLTSKIRKRFLGE